MSLNYGMYGIFLIMGNAGFISSAAGPAQNPGLWPQALKPPNAHRTPLSPNGPNGRKKERQLALQKAFFRHIENPVQQLLKQCRTPKPQTLNPTEFWWGAKPRVAGKSATWPASHPRPGLLSPRNFEGQLGGLGLRL